MEQGTSFSGGVDVVGVKISSPARLSVVGRCHDALSSTEDNAQGSLWHAPQALSV